MIDYSTACFQFNLLSKEALLNEPSPLDHHWLLLMSTIAMLKPAMLQGGEPHAERDPL